MKLKVWCQKLKGNTISNKKQSLPTTTTDLGNRLNEKLVVYLGTCARFEEWG